MIESIKVTNHLNQSLTMILKSPEKSGLAIVSILGLEPPKAEIALTERAGIDGSIYNSARADYRNIVISLRYLPDEETNRQKTYQYFPLKRNIRLDIVTENREVYAYGYVESNSAKIFTNKAGCIISILCPESYLYDIDESVTYFSSINPLFEFPFSNESLVSPALEFSEIILETEKNVVYSGDAQVGFILHIHATGAANDVSITNSLTLEELAIDSTKLAAATGSDIIAGDDFYISTINGDKYAKLIRSSTEYNILNCLTADSKWLKLEKGNNYFAYDADSGLDNLEFEITSNLAYEGV